MFDRWSAPDPTPAHEGNGLAVAGIVLGGLGLFGSVIPLLNIGAMFLGLIGIGISIMGLVHAKKIASGKRMALAGLIMGVLSIGVGIVVNTVFLGAIS